MNQPIVAKRVFRHDGDGFATILIAVQNITLPKSGRMIADVCRGLAMARPTGVSGVAGMPAVPGMAVMIGIAGMSRRSRMSTMFGMPGIAI